MYIENPKTKGSGIVGCIPQTGICPNQCADCFFQSGRSYLEPLDENLPNIPPPEMFNGHVVRVNDGNDSGNNRELVMRTAKQFDDYFYNTAIPELGEYDNPVVLTINPADMTDIDFYRVDSPTLMYVRIRTNMWNLDMVKAAVDYYTNLNIPIVLTYMAYYKNDIPKQYEGYYEWKKRTLNSYWVITKEGQRNIEEIFIDNPLVYSCGGKMQKSCKYCGNCLREYYATKERMRVAE